MGKIPMYLWQTCRLLANETRLKLLNEVFTAPDQCVEHIAASVQISPSTASTQLKWLCWDGFISVHRSGQTVFYDANIPPAPFWISELQRALIKSLEQKVSLKDLCRQATGFTHQRRIELTALLSVSPLTLPQLEKCTVMSRTALLRHVRKLRTRGYVVLSNETYRLGRPSGLLAKALLKTIRTGAKQ